MWALAWVESGCCVGVISMGWVRRGLCGRWRVWGFEHRRTPTCTCLPACLSACQSVSQSVSQHVWSGPTDRDTVHHDYHCNSRARQDSGLARPGPQGHNRHPSSPASQPHCCSILELPWLKQRTEATDPQDSGLVPRSSSCCRRLNNVPPIPSSLPLETDDICAT